MSTKRVSSIRQPTRSEVKVFFELLITYFEKHTEKLHQLISNNFAVETQERIYSKFVKAAKPARGILSSTMFCNYTKLWRNMDSPREEYLGILRNNCIQSFGCFGGCQNSTTSAGKKHVKTEETIDYPIRPKMPDNVRKPRVGLFIEPAVRGYYAESYKFHLMNFKVSEVDEYNKMSVEKLIIENGGIVLSEDVLDEAPNRDTYVINFGPVNDEVINFLKEHQQDIYNPSLITNAHGKGLFSPDELHICMDRLRFMTKSMEILKPEVEEPAATNGCNAEALKTKCTIEKGVSAVVQQISVSCNTDTFNEDEYEENAIVVKKVAQGVPCVVKVSSYDKMFNFCAATWWPDGVTAKRAWLLDYLFKKVWTEQRVITWSDITLAIQEEAIVFSVFNTAWETKRELKSLLCSAVKQTGSERKSALQDIQAQITYLSDDFVSTLKEAVLSET